MRWRAYVSSESAYGVEAVVDEMLEVLAHADLPHQLVLVAVHSRQLAHVGKDVLQTVGQLQRNTAQRLDNLSTAKSLDSLKIH